MQPFAPADATIPSGFTTARVKLRKLTINDLVKDYDALMSSVAHLQGVFGPRDTWPAGLSLEENLVDLGWHQKEFELRRSFAYTVMNLDESQCLGCLYVTPSQKQGYEAKVIMWVRQSELSTGLDEHLFSAAKTWLSEQWWCRRVAYPGRALSWQQWEQLADKIPPA